MSGFVTKKRRQFFLFLFSMIFVSSLWGLGLSRITPTVAQTPVAPTPITQSVGSETNAPEITTTDIVPSNYLPGQELYLKNCATCHLAVPPAVLPRQTWNILLRDPSHYGAILTPLRNPDYSIVAQYLSRYSRPLDPGEAIPYRISSSRYFKLIHPRVQFEQPARLNTCATCHPQAQDFNFRQVTDQWKDAP